MGLTDSELIRLKLELGFAGLTVQAEPYISYISLFDQIIKPFLQAGTETTSTTVVPSVVVSTPNTLTLADVTGFAMFSRAVVDVDDSEETATIQSVAGSTITVELKKAHGPGAYPVQLEGAASIVRQYLRRISAEKLKMEKLLGTGALKQVDEIGFYPTRDRTQFANIYDQLMTWRRECASAIGFVTAWDVRGSGSARASVY